MGDLKTTFIVFLAALVAFHFTLLVKKLPKKMWLVSDYAYYGVALLGLIAATSRVVQVLDDMEIDAARNNIQWNYGLAIDAARENAAYYRNLVNRLPRDSEETAKYEAVAGWFERVLDALRKGYESGAWREVIAVVPWKISNPCTCPASRITWSARINTCAAPPQVHP